MIHFLLLKHQSKFQESAYLPTVSLYDVIANEGLKQIEVFKRLEIPLILRWNNRRFLGEVLQMWSTGVSECLFFSSAHTDPESDLDYSPCGH